MTKSFLSTVYNFEFLLQAAALTAETTETRQRTVRAGHAAAISYNELLRQVHAVSLGNQSFIMFSS